MTISTIRIKIKIIVLIIKIKFNIPLVCKKFKAKLISAA